MENKNIYKIWFSWHRNKYLEDIKNRKNIDYNIYIYNYLDELLKNIDKNKLEFNIWGANWFDTIIWLYCLEKQITYNLFLPYKNIEKQIEGWTEKEKKDFIKIYKDTLCKNIYYFNWYFERNRAIVNNSDLLVVWYLNIDKSWTKYTIDYANKQKLIVKNIFYKINN